MMSFDPRSMSVMLVVSNPHLRRLLGTILQAIGFKEVKVLKTAKEAVQMMPTLNLDLIIAANELEDASGIRLAKVVRAAPRQNLQRVPIVLFLEKPTRELVNEAQTARVTAVMTLPTSIKAVVAKLAAVFAKAKA